MTLTGTNTYSGLTTISAGTLQLGNGLSIGALNASGSIADNGTLAFNNTGTVTQGIQFSSSPIYGTGGLAKSGSGALVLTATNTYSGLTAISAGSLQLGNGTAVGAWPRRAPSRSAARSSSTTAAPRRRARNSAVPPSAARAD